MINKTRSSWILHMGTYPPRECGIATFTQDLANAMDKEFSPKIKSKILAMDYTVSPVRYPKKVILQLNQEDVQGYVDVAEKINKTDEIKIVNIQHEFGIFGGYYGEHLLKFIESLNKPLIVTFHTVVPHTIHRNNNRKKIVQKIAKKSKQIIVLNKLAINILREDYGVDDSKIVVIPHGIHDVPFENNTKEKAKLGYKDKITITTFGFVRKSKGYEYAIEALPEVINKFPDVLYLVVGETHPVIRSKKGESYFKLLKNRVKKLGLQKNVKFINNYVKLRDLIKYLKATDLYLCSTTSSGQIVSGTLAYAMGCGRAVVSAPFLHAKEIVTPERGIIVKDFKNPKLLSKAIIKILSNPSLKSKMGKNAYKYTRRMVWSNVAKSYMKVFREYM